MSLSPAGRVGLMAYDIEIKDLEDRYVASIRVQTTPDKIGETYGEVLPEVDAEILNAGARPSGPPFAIYHAFEKNRVDMEVGFPLPEPIPTAGRVMGRELSATLAAVTWHVGPYTGLGSAYSALEAWLAEQGKEAAGPPWEVYWTGPADETDSARWRTEVGYPIA
jgi:effector-binding domain-containing protein